MRFIVTVKDLKNPDHDPMNKKTGPCKWSDLCTDVTGEHHSFLATADSADQILEQYRANEIHVTRIEAV